MALTAAVRKTVTAPKPLYAAAGAGDLIVERLRRFPGQVRDQLHPKLVQGRLAALRGNLAALPTRTQAAARSRFDRADAAYDGLVARGVTLLRRERPQQTTQQLVDQAQRRVRRARAAREAASKPATGPARARKTTRTRAGKTAGVEPERIGD
jgi:heparin binding hemagglutinin HbhA